MARGETYKEFVAKFNKENPKTTDDCYTPPEIYEVVLDWAEEHLNIGDRPVVRPFYPGGDFENFDYPENCVVVDNPPFSIFAKILRWYNERGIKFFLFAHFLTSIREGVTLVCTDTTITYDNGAFVKTGFVTNMMGNLLCVTAPDLTTKIKETQRKLENTPPKRKYLYPRNVLRASTLESMARRGIPFSVSSEEGSILPKVTSKKGGEFGASIILCDRKRKEIEDIYIPPIYSDAIKLELNDKAKAEIERLNALDRIDNPQYYD